MASKLRLDKIDLILCDADLNARQATRMVLQNQGFRDIRVGNMLEDLVRILSQHSPDLLLSECQLPDGDFCKFLRDVRDKKIGSNPFISVIALTANPTPELIKEVMDSGADDILTKPVSTRHLMDRIGALTTDRKPFIVTENYVGPMRGQDKKADTPPKRIEVPNTLKTKADGGKVNYLAVEEAIESSLSAVNEGKTEAMAVHISKMVKEMAPVLRNGVVDSPVLRMIDELLATAQETSERMMDTRYSHVSELCRALIGVMHDIKSAGARPNERDVLLLPPLAQAIQVGFAGGIDSAQTAKAIVDQIHRKAGQ